MIKIDSVEQSINEEMTPILNICLEFDIEKYQDLVGEVGEEKAREMFMETIFNEITKDKNE